MSKAFKRYHERITMLKACEYRLKQYLNSVKTTLTGQVKQGVNAREEACPSPCMGKNGDMQGSSGLTQRKYSSKPVLPNHRPRDSICCWLLHRVSGCAADYLAEYPVLLLTFWSCDPYLLLISRQRTCVFAADFSALDSTTPFPGVTEVTL